MEIRIVLAKNGDEDTVILKDRSLWEWTAWLKRTERAVAIVRAALDANRVTPAAQSAHAWLGLCGVTTQAQFEDLERHLPQLRLPMSAANGRRCRKCGAKIWGKLALVTGLGSECRRGGNRAAKQVRELRARFAAPVSKATRLELARAVLAAQ